MVNSQTKLVIFSDLDGTLLDHETYSYEAALPTLKRLQDLNVPVILTTSKTQSEVSDLQNEIGLKDFSIVENGAAIFPGQNGLSDQILSGNHKIFGASYADIRKLVEKLPQDLRNVFVGFGDLSDKEVAKATGLPLEKAQKAKQRLASEPFSWLGTTEDFQRLKTFFEDEGLCLLQGGRFYHLLSRVDKSKAISWVLGKVQSHLPDVHIVSVALGDGPNDIAMIEFCDHGVVVKNPKGVKLEIGTNETSVLYTQKAGPEGWAEAIDVLLEKYQL